jgi:hypothetical protein
MTKIKLPKQGYKGHLLVKLVELAKAIAMSTYDLSLVLPCRIYPQGRSHFPDETHSITFRTPMISIYTTYNDVSPDGTTYLMTGCSGPSRDCLPYPICPQGHIYKDTCPFEIVF